jgi:hypothetical protein
MADGVEPASATLQDVNFVWPCLSKRSMVSVGDAVLYATSFGLAMIGASGPQMFTQNFFTEAEWKPFSPTTMECEVSEGRVFVKHDAGLMVFKLQEQAMLTSSTVLCDGLYTDATDGELYVLQSGGVYKFDADDGARLTLNWTSKEFEVPTPLNFGAARVEITRQLSTADELAIADLRATILAANQAALTTYSTTGDGAVNGKRINGVGVNAGPTLQELPLVDNEYLTFTLITDGQVRFSKTITQSQSFRLPAGYLCDRFSVQVTGNVRVHSIRLAETMDGLRQA